ncbi:MAG: hypothetical protein JW741_12520 [Sedimentisphaerales bacterium]|nr:hypothetical protein [Sedimentisphaerales bacterium]
MVRNLLIVTLAVAAWVGGCVVISSDEEPPRPVVVEPDDATIREIDAVGRLAFDHDRKSGYERIAGRQGLSGGAQVYLVKAVFKHLSFENAKVDVLLTLVRNPSFTSAAEAALLDRLDRLAFENDKRRILDAVSARK